MKQFYVLLITFCAFTTIKAQQNSVNFNAEGGEFKTEQNMPCLTNTQRTAIKETLKKSYNQLKATGKLKYEKSTNIPNPKFIWPIQKASHVTYNDTWGISNYVDHNTAYPNQLTDYNCGSKTYDTESGYNHKGIDVFLWPFRWHQMDNNQTEVIAASAGQIIAKHDGNYDRSCSFNSNFWNAVYVENSDGSISWYGHLKNGSLTTKAVGETVTAGEYLGVVGSSGNSTGPHLHFEVYEDNTYSQLIDPYAGSCNSLNSESWWQDQKPYVNPNINAVLTHNTPPVFNS